ncbi:myotubularin-related protein [Cavenderia fasciculata]|uniref:Myotubularin-related protein n=1 Tax=Cavenderia fasciculata TaxID=261658 RepID=F4PX85_CACFS|nr:myotubularin-related protein [Cavenderia fasciculata]EGG19888.1 myotubularin-related protein [Cavenderia fasciculata]|eukprot:XP_004366871.1 myotubularin-related protein [Cavenderia fasciculata]
MSEDDLFINDDDSPVLGDSTNRPQPSVVENTHFILLPGEILLLSSPNVVLLCVGSNEDHRIGTLYQTNFQLFFVEDSKKEISMSLPNGLVMEIKKLKGQVTVKYKDPNAAASAADKLQSNDGATTSTSNTILSSSTSTSTSTSTTTTNNQIETIPKSTSNSISLSDVNGISEKALILEIRSKDFNIIRICLPTNEKGLEAYNILCRMSFIDNPCSFFAQSFSPFKPTLPINGWTIYDPIEEYIRQGLLNSDGQPGEWRLTKINSKYELCSTYPQHVVIPFSISDYIIQKSAEFRGKSRFPVCTWRHKYTRASLSRSSQPISLSGKNTRCEEDELLIQGIRKSTPLSNVSTNPVQTTPTTPTSTSTTQPISGSTSTSSSSLNPNSSSQGVPLVIFDVRPKSTVASTFKNSAVEDMNNYSNCILDYGGLPNIHELRESSNKLFKTIRNWDDKKSWHDVNTSSWLNQVGKLLSASKKILTYLHNDGSSVLIHCTDGWDRTCQLMSLVQLLADPYYRTIKGFIVLICKEWLSFGHKFMTRTGSLSSLSAKQTSPVFLQFIDCVWQLLRQFPTSFEFTDQFLHLLLHHVNSNLFGTFLYDSDRDRTIQKIQQETISLWSFLLNCVKEGNMFLNNLYVSTTEEIVQQNTSLLMNEETNLEMDGEVNTTTTTTTTPTTIPFIVRKGYDSANVLFPNILGVQLWTDYYLKWRIPQKLTRKPYALIDRALGIHGFNGDLLHISKKKKQSRRLSKYHSSSVSAATSSASAAKSLSSDNLLRSQSTLSEKRKKKKKRENQTDGGSNIDINHSTPRLTIIQPIVETNPTITTTDVNEELTIVDLDNNNNNVNNGNIEILEESTLLSSMIKPIVLEEQRVGQLRRHSTSNSSPIFAAVVFKESDSPNLKAIEQQKNVQVPPPEQLEPSIEQVQDPLLVQQESNNTSTTTTTTTTTVSNEKQRRKEKKARKERERQERRERKERKRLEKKEKEVEKEKKAPIITVVLSNNKKSKPINGASTMPIRGSKSRISIFSISSSPPPPLQQGAQPLSPTMLSPIQSPSTDAMANNDSAAAPAVQHQPISEPPPKNSFSRMFKTLAIRGQKSSS